MSINATHKNSTFFTIIYQSPVHNFPLPMHDKSYIYHDHPHIHPAWTYLIDCNYKEINGTDRPIFPQIYPFRHFVSMRRRLSNSRRCVNYYYVVFHLLLILIIYRILFFRGLNRI